MHATNWQVENIQKQAEVVSLTYQRTPEVGTKQEGVSIGDPVSWPVLVV
jgi:hypothetical protein